MINGLSDLKLKDPKGRFCVSIDSKQIAELLHFCAKAEEHETGGILLGYYNEKLDLATVVRVVDAPSDSQHGLAWFHRGIVGLQTLILKLWSERRQYYLGEWHYHPYGSPEASNTDTKQMKEIASSRSYKCPEPILLIVAGNVETSWSIQVMVFPKNEEYPVKLYET